MEGGGQPIDCTSRPPWVKPLSFAKPTGGPTATRLGNFLFCLIYTKLKITLVNFAFAICGNSLNSLLASTIIIPSLQVLPNTGLV
jgi:hypothetical protein